MTGNHFDPNWQSQVTVPVKRVGDRWEFFYGGDVPVKDGTLGELTLSVAQITDERFRAQVTQELVVKVLDQGAPLWVALSDRSRGGAHFGTWPKHMPPNVPDGTTRFECIWLGPSKPLARLPAEKFVGPPKPGGLWLKLNGLERTELLGSTVLMPKDFHVAEARSLNHALTLLSQAYEKHRISNTGNVYTRMFYEEAPERWYPLNDLRQGVQAMEERRLLAETWRQVEVKLGWRPLHSKKGTIR